jgi:hypothetical protein
MRPLLALIVFLLDLAAIGGLLRARLGPARRIGWLASIVLLPFIGAAAWFARHGRAGFRTAVRTP